MSSTKSKKTKPKLTLLLKKKRAGLAKLKKAGLYSGDARSAKGNSYQTALLKRYADVVSGKAATVKISAKAAKEVADAGGKVRYVGKDKAGNKQFKVAVERKKGERVRFDKKTNTIVGTVNEYGNEFKRKIYFQKVFNPSKLPRPPKGEIYYYKVAFKGEDEDQGVTPQFTSLDELIDYMNRYRQMQSKLPRVREQFVKDYASHVVVYEVKDKSIFA